EACLGSERTLPSEKSKSLASYPSWEYSSRCLINNQDSLPPNPLVRTSAKDPRSFFPYRRNFRFPSCRLLRATLSASPLSTISFRTPLLTSTSGLYVPSSQIMTGPAPFLPLMTPSKCRYSSRWSPVGSASRLRLLSSEGPLGIDHEGITSPISSRKS